MENFYKSISQLQILILNVGFAEHYADWNWKNVISPFMRIYYVTEGNAKIVFPDKIQDVKPNHLYLIPPYTKHSYICSGNFKHYYLHIYEDQNYSSNTIFDSWNFPYEIEATSLDLELFKMLSEINPSMKLQQSNPETYDNNSTLIENIIRNQQMTLSNIMQSRGIVFQLLSRFMNKITPKDISDDNRIQNCIYYIRKNINRKIEIEYLSKLCCLSKDHFIHLFKKEVGVPPLHYINRKKIERAQLLLLTEDISLKEISYMLSFEDHSYFIRLFKKYVGISPILYKRMNSKQ